jgi:hypothetical protein
MLQLLLTVSAGLAGYFLARNFVRNRLRFVDAIQSGWARERGADHHVRHRHRVRHGLRRPDRSPW